MNLENENPEGGDDSIAADTVGETNADDAGTAAQDAAGEDREPLEPATPEDVATTAKEFLEGIVGALGLAADVATSIEDGTAFVDVTGEDLGGLIGRRGQTLDALQEIARTGVQRRLRARVRLLVDVEGYRARRRTSLIDYAREMAERAKERGTEIELEPMTAYERKIVHQAVSEIEGASSFSEGEEPNRKVVIRGD